MSFLWLLWPQECLKEQKVTLLQLWRLESVSAGPASLAGRGWGRCCPGLSPLCTAAALLSRGCWCPTCGDPASKRGHVHRHRGRGFHVFRGTQFTAPHGVHSPPRRPCPARALCVPRVGGFGWESVRGLLLRPLQRSRFQVVSSAAVPVQAEALGERTCHFFRVSRRGRLWGHKGQPYRGPRSQKAVLLCGSPDGLV